MLTIMGLTIARLKNTSQPPPAATIADTVPAPPSSTSSSASDDESASPPAEDVEPKAADLSPEETAAFEQDIQAVLDLATEIHPTEMPAYNRLLDWARRLPPDAIKKAAQVRFHDLVKKPDLHRGELIRVRLSVRRVLSYQLPGESPDTSQTVYELWGWPVEANGWLYVVVTPKLPKGFPTSGLIDVNVDVCGYFFKLQGYQPGNAKPGAKALAAPLIVGRVVQLPGVIAPSSPVFSPLALGGVFVGLAAIAAVWAWSQRGRWGQTGRRGSAVVEHAQFGDHSPIPGDTAAGQDRLNSTADETDSETGSHSKRLDFDWLGDE
jgi:hypothetical protein